jgi:glutamyl-tRNA synthetase
MNLEEEIRKYALQNAIKYKGKANPGALVGQILNLDPDLKAKMKEIMPQIKSIVDEVNAMGFEAQKVELEKVAPELLDWSKEEKPRAS